MTNRPPIARKLVSLPPDLLAAIDDFRFTKRLKSQTEAIRVLLREAVAAHAASNAPKGGRAGRK